MGGWTLFFCAAAVGMLAILWTDHIRRQHERMDAERMRGSMLYYEIYIYEGVIHAMIIWNNAKLHQLIMHKQLGKSTFIFFENVFPEHYFRYWSVHHGSHQSMIEQKQFECIKIFITERLNLVLKHISKHNQGQVEKKPK